MYRFVLAAASAAFFVTAAPALAATVVIEQTADLSGASSPYPGYLELAAEHFSPVNVQIAEGDTIDWTVRFQPGQSVAPVDPTFIFMTLFPAIGPFNYMTQNDPAQLQLLGANDEVLADYTVDFNGVSSSYIIGLFHKAIPVSGTLFGPSTPTFSGLRTVLHLGEYFGIDQTVLTFNSATLQFGGFETVVAAPAPEPATWTMLILGFGAVGSAIRRRRSLAVG